MAYAVFLEIGFGNRFAFLRGERRKGGLMKDDIKKRIDEKFLMIEPITTSQDESSGGEADNQILQLQLTMATSSINHEYARLEFEDTADTDQKEALLDYMNECRKKYFKARSSLVIYDEQAAQDFEADLFMQKKRTMGQFNA